MWRRRIALSTALVGVTFAWAVVGTSSAAANSWGLTGSQFQTGDGNLEVEEPASTYGAYDWDNLNNYRGDGDTSTAPDTFTVSMTNDKSTGALDDSFGNGTKEDTAVPTVVDGSIPPNKSDLREFGSWTERNSEGEFLHLFWSRVQDPSGTTNMDFELNAKSCPPLVQAPAVQPSRADCSTNGVTPVRSQGDLLITYDLSRGGTEAAIDLREWDGSLWQDDELTPGSALGSINTTAITSATALTGKTYSLRTFGEASVNLAELLDPTVCRSFGSAYLKSRSSDSFTSAVKDFIAPVGIDVSNCGSIKIEKRDDSRPPVAVAGATFAVYTNPASPATSQPVVQGETTLTTGVNAATTTVTMQVADPTRIPSYTALIRIDSEWMRITNRNDAAKTLTVERAANSRPTTPTTAAEHAANAKVEAVASCATSGSFDPTTGSGKVATCTLPNLLYGSYLVWETRAPTGYQVATGSQQATLGRTAPLAFVSFTNNRAPATISITKTDDSGNPLGGRVFVLYEDKDTSSTVTTGDILTPYSCTTTTSVTATTADPIGTCRITGILTSGAHVVREDPVPAGFGAAADWAVTIAAGGSYTPPTFVNPRHYTVIVLVCQEGDGTLYEGNVTLGSSTVKTPTVLPSAGPTVAQVCSSTGLAGITGKSVYPDKVKGTYAPSIVIPSPSA